MDWILVVVIALAALGVAATFLMMLGLGGSDAAGNGLGQAYVAIGTAAAAALTSLALLLASSRVPPEWAGSGPITFVLLALVLVSAPTTLLALFTSTLGPGPRASAAALACLGPAAALVHAAWRAHLLPSHPRVAVTGTLVAAVVGLFGPLLVRAAVVRRQPRQRTGMEEVAWPALVLRAGVSVHVVRGVDELQALGAERASAAVTVDARNVAWRIAPSPSRAAWAAVREPAQPSFESVRDAVLALPPLHPDPGVDAEARRLVRLQRDVTALSFVLPR